MCIFPDDIITYFLRHCHVPNLFLTCKTYQNMMTVEDKYRFLSYHTATYWRLEGSPNLHDIVPREFQSKYDLSKEEFHNVIHEDMICYAIKYNNKYIYYCEKDEYLKHVNIYWWSYTIKKTNPIS